MRGEACSYLGDVTDQSSRTIDERTENIFMWGSEIHSRGSFEQHMLEGRKSFLQSQPHHDWTQTPGLRRRGKKYRSPAQTSRRRSPCESRPAPSGLHSVTPAQEALTISGRCRSICSSEPTAIAEFPSHFFFTSPRLACPMKPKPTAITSGFGVQRHPEMYNLYYKLDSRKEDLRPAGTESRLPIKHEIFSLSSFNCTVPLGTFKV